MALIVEDGSIVANANGYISVAELKTYWSNRNTTLTQTDDELAAAIIIATQHVDYNYTFKGSIVNSTQSLAWPRTGVVDGRGVTIANNVIPVQLKNAIAEFAQRQATAPIQPDVESTGIVKRTKVKVDVIEEETEYEEGTAIGFKSFPQAENYLRGLTTGGAFGNFGRVGTC